MEGYYFLGKDHRREALYIPYNLMVFEEEGVFSIFYKAGSLEIFDDDLVKNNPYTLREGEKIGLIKSIQIPNNLLREFQDYCFAGNDVLAHSKATELFLLAKKEVKCQ